MRNGKVFCHSAFFIFNNLFIFAKMKWYCPIGTVCLLAFLYACTSSVKIAEPDDTASPTLSAIDSLMWRQPDSAFALLLQFVGSPEADGLDTYNRHYCQLLISELLYKNDYEQSNRPALRQAVAYFDSLTFTLNETPTLKSLIAGADPLSLTRNDRITFLTARAHYINGVGYYENDSIVEACAEYLKVVEIMESGFEEKELEEKKALFLAMAYTRLTVLFSDLYLHEQAIYFAKVSLAYYQKQESPSWYQAWVMNEVGSHYDMMDELDSAYYYYHKASVMINDTTILLYRDITTHQAYLKYKANNQKDFALIELYHLLSEAENEKEYCSRCAIIGEIYYHEKQFDSAWVYLNKVYQTTSVENLKKQAAEWLVEIGKAKGMEVHDYTVFLVPFANLEENTSEIKSQLTELYKAFGQVQQERHHQREMRRHRNRSIIVVAGLSSLIIIVLALHYNKKRQKKHLENQINDEKQAHNLEKKALSVRLKKSNETLRELKDQIKRQDELDVMPKQAALFTDEPICQLIMKRVKEGKFKSKVNYLDYKDSALSKQQLFDLRVATDQHFDRFTIRLKNAYPQLTNGDLDYCCLYLLGLTNADLAALMQRAYNTVVERDGKLKKIFGKDNPLPITLMGIAKNSLSV